MTILKSTLFSVITALTLLAPLPVRACPLCAEAIAESSAGSAEEEKNDFPLAMNRSIYLMVSVPYLALGLVGFLIYRGVRKNEEFLQADHATTDV